MLDKYYNAMRTAETLEALKAVYEDARQAFVDDKITLEEYHSLRQCFHNMRILKF